MIIKIAEAKTLTRWFIDTECINKETHNFLFNDNGEFEIYYLISYITEICKSKHDEKWNDDLSIVSTFVYFEDDNYKLINRNKYNVDAEGEESDDAISRLDNDVDLSIVFYDFNNIRKIYIIDKKNDDSDILEYEFDENGVISETYYLFKKYPDTLKNPHTFIFKNTTGKYWHCIDTNYSSEAQDVDMIERGYYHYSCNYLTFFLFKEYIESFDGNDNEKWTNDEYKKLNIFDDFIYNIEWGPTSDELEETGDFDKALDEYVTKAENNAQRIITVDHKKCIIKVTIPNHKYPGMYLDYSSHDEFYKGWYMMSYSKRKYVELPNLV